MSRKEPDRGTLPEKSHENCRLAFCAGWIGDIRARKTRARRKLPGHVAAMAPVKFRNAFCPEVKGNGVGNEGDERRPRLGPCCASPPFWDDNAKWKSALQDREKETEAVPFWLSCPRSTAGLGLLRTHFGGSRPTNVIETLRSCAAAFPPANQKLAAAAISRNTVAFMAGTLRGLFLPVPDPRLAGTYLSRLSQRSKRLLRTI